MHRLKKIVSGGQTGVDQAALQAAIDARIEHGGWCPRGRLCETGKIPSRYRLKQTDSRRYAVRTERNVVDSDGTLILYRTTLQGGTALTLQMARRHDRPVLLVDLQTPLNEQNVSEWLSAHDIQVLNVAGPRESTAAGIHDEAYQFLLNLLQSGNG